jgi:hypothetical protein
MSRIVYTVHRAIGRPVTFKGLKGQYIILAGAGLIGDLFLFVILYCCKLSPWICMGIAFSAGAALLITCMQLSARYGQYGLLKQRASRRIPSYLRCRSRKPFTNINKKLCNTKKN